PSRRHSLEELIGRYAISEETESRNTLTALLGRAAARLGPSGERSNLGDPSFMVVHALNLVDPKNWREVAVKRSDGTEIQGHNYEPPEEEQRHLERLQEESRDRFATSNMQNYLALALDPSRSSPELAAAGVDWAHPMAATEKDGGRDED